jgi:adenylate cyclase
MFRRALPLGIALLLAGIWGAILAGGHLRGGVWLVDRIESTMTDLRFLLRGPRAAPDTVTIVAIDDEAASQGRAYPLPRATLARLVDRIASFGPRVIAVDILLLDSSDEASDGALAKSLMARTSVIAAAALYSSSRQQTPADGLLAGIPVADRLLFPLPQFADAAAVGVVNVASDGTGAPREIPLLFRTEDQLELSLPLRVAALAEQVDPVLEPGLIVLGNRPIRTDIGQSMPLAFYGPRGTIDTVSAAELLAGRADADLLRGRIVVIGATVTGGGDVFPTPFDPLLPGVEVVSTAISQLVSGEGLVRDRWTRTVDAGLAVALPVVLVALLSWRRNAAGLIAAAAVVLLVLGANFYAFVQGFWLSLALPAVAAIIPVVAFGGEQIWLSRRRARRLAAQSELLQRVQAPGLSQWLARNPAFLNEPVRQSAAVVFVDLSGFTALSEKLGPSATRELLDDFYELVAQCAYGCGGAVTSFLGDGAMLLFGLPEPDAKDARKAANCCVVLTRRIREWLDAQPQDTASSLGFKIGAHFGEVVASRLGRGENQQIAAMGDTVNVANRLMHVAAERGAPVVVSDELFETAGPEVFDAGALTGPALTSLRGRSSPVMVWEWREAVPHQP